MKKLVLQGLLLFGIAGSALASGAAESGGNGFMIALFLGFFGVVIVFQLIPSLVVFFTVIKELFSRRQTEAPQVAKRDEGR